MANTHDIEQDETNKESIVRYIERHVESLSAVLIFADSNTHVRAEYAFSTLSAILPKTLVDNIATIYSHPVWGFVLEKIPEALKSSPRFTLYNPISFRRGLPVVAKNREDGALNTLVAFFDWLDDREPQPAKKIVSLYEKYQKIEAKTITILDQRAQEVEIDKLKTRLKKHSAVSLHIACIWRSSLMLVGGRT